ncbi:uncharacterized protein LOC142785105 isoform X2 [Rhipicephalus microplus]|uniref:uncharacterized protein LOC142785105 isoform X2 n=1 Tax=Rhipicephalus microplus TaxID=6941 RepID=UPI003F6D8AC1
MLQKTLLLAPRTAPEHVFRDAAITPQKLLSPVPRTASKYVFLDSPTLLQRIATKYASLDASSLLQKVLSRAPRTLPNVFLDVSIPTTKGTSACSQDCSQVRLSGCIKTATKDVPTLLEKAFQPAPRTAPKYVLLDDPNLLEKNCF